MFTDITSNTPNRLQQKNHGSTIVPRPVIVRFSFGSRSVLDHFSLGPRSSLVRLSFVIR